MKDNELMLVIIAELSIGYIILASLIGFTIQSAYTDGAPEEPAVTAKPSNLIEEFSIVPQPAESIQMDDVYSRVMTETFGGAEEPGLK